MAKNDGKYSKTLMFYAGTHVDQSPNNPMNTTNLISTPDITGNIGSCTTQVTTAYSKRTSMWRAERTDIATNSCTGQVEHFVSWEYTGVAGLGFIGLFIVGIVVFFAILIAFFNAW